MNNTCFNGDVGEMIVATELIKNGIDVCKSLMNNKMYDFIIIGNNGFGNPKKIQVKSSTTFNGDKVTFTLKTTRLIQGKWIYKTYQEGDVDYLFCVNNQTNDVFLLEPKDFIGKTTFSIRYTPSNSTNTSISNYYKDYILDNNINKLNTSLV